LTPFWSTENIPSGLKKGSFPVDLLYKMIDPSLEKDGFLGTPGP